MYVMYAIFNFWFAITIWYFYPETKNKTLEEMDLVFARKYGSPEAIAQLEGLSGSVEKPTSQELESSPKHI